jgi:hypothetical protein
MQENKSLVCLGFDREGKMSYHAHWQDGDWKAVEH